MFTYLVYLKWSLTHVTFLMADCIQWYNLMLTLKTNPGFIEVKMHLMLWKLTNTCSI